MEKQRFLESLNEIVGKENVMLDDSTRKQKSQDLYALRLYQKHVGWEPTLPVAVVEPANTEEISKLLKLCNENNIPVIPYGGGSGVLAGAETVNENTLVIDLKKLDKVLDFSDENLTVTCQSGVFINDLEAYANEKGFILGHYPQSMDLAEMGGLVATRSIGQFSTKYGGISLGNICKTRNL